MNFLDMFLWGFLFGGGDKYPLNVCQLSSNFVFVIFTFSPKLVKKVTKPSLKKITHLHHQKGHGGRNSGYQGSPSLRLFQHTPGTYPTPWTKTLWRNSFHLGGWGCLGYAPGVCWGSLRPSQKPCGRIKPGLSHRLHHDRNLFDRLAGGARWTDGGLLKWNSSYLANGQP